MNLKDWKINLIAIFIMIFSGIFHFYQCTLEPYLNWDEFLYSTRAYAFIRLFSDPIPMNVIYSDHPPLGWIILGIGCIIFPTEFSWTLRARLVISVFFVLNQIMLYLITLKYYSKPSGIITLLLFGFQIGFLDHTRRIYLDNIGVFFVLFAYYLYLSSRSSQYPVNTSPSNVLIIKEIPTHTPIQQFYYSKLYYYLSGVFLGLAICVKFVFVFFIPGFILMYYCRNCASTLLERVTFLYHLKNIIRWIGYTLIPLIVYLIVCLLLNQLHEVITGTINQVLRRESDATFGNLVFYWMLLYPVFFVVLMCLLSFFLLGFVMYLFINIRSHDQKSLFFNKTHSSSILKRLHALFIGNMEVWGFCFGFFLFLIRGSTISSHYMIPLYSFGSLFIGVFIVSLYRLIIPEKSGQINTHEKVIYSTKILTPTSLKKLVTGLYSLCLIIWMIYPPEPLDLIKITTSTSFQTEALDWVLINVPRNSSFIVNAFFAAELYEAGYRNVQVSGFFNPSTFNNDWRNIDYLITPSLEGINGTFTAPAIENCLFLQHFEYGGIEINIYQVKKI